MLRRNSWRNLISEAMGQISQKQRRKRNKAGVMLESLESRAMLAATTFDNGTLTIDFSTAGESVTVSNDGTNFTISSSDSVTGAGASFATNTVTRLVVTDSGDQTGQLLTIAGSADYSLSGGLNVTGAERAALNRALSTVTAELSVTTGESISVAGMLSATEGHILLSANQQATAATGTFDGIVINGVSVSTTGTGTVTLLGRGGDNGAAGAHGVDLLNAASVSGASTTVTGTGGDNTGGTNQGVSLTDGSIITSTGGNVVVTGAGAGSGGSNTGVVVATGSQITAAGSGTVMVSGTGSGTGNFSYGVTVTNTNSFITSAGGAVTVMGTGGAGLGADGVVVQVGGALSAGGTGTLTVTGTANSTGSASFGVLLTTSNALITSGGGNISITAISNGNTGLALFSAAIDTSSSNANLEITSNSISVDSASAISSGSGQTTIKTYTAGTLIDLGGNDVLSGSLSLGLSAAELTRITAGTLVIGDATAGNMTVSQAVSYAGNLTLTTGAGVTASNSLALSANKTLMVNAVGTINLSGSSADFSVSGSGVAALTTQRDIQIAGGSVTSVDGNILLRANQEATATTGNFRGIYIVSASVTSTGTGMTTLQGRGGDDASLQAGVFVDTSLVSGKIVSITGRGGAGGGNAVGVYNAGTLRSTGGGITITGFGGGAGSSATNKGVLVTSDASIEDTGSGDVTVEGTGGNTTGGSNSGVEMTGGDSSFITSAGGNISVTGTGGGTGTGTGTGIHLVRGVISAGGTGTVTVIGQGFNTTAVSLLSTSTIGASGGAVDVTAVNSGPTPGILMDTTSSVTSAGGASLQITTDSMNFLGSINSGVGTTTIRTYSAATQINMGGNDVISGSLTLGLSAAELNLVTAGTLIIGRSTAGNITVSAAVAPANVSQLELVTGGQILDTNASGTDITVARLGLTASTGIGLGNALDIAVGNLEASTATGGILVNNTGALTIGGVNSTLAGLRVTGASGNIDLGNTAGNVRITTAGDIVLAPGDVSIQTLTSGNIITANNDGFNFSSFTGAVNSSGATLTLNAAGDIDLGETGDGNVRGDLKSLGNMTLTAGGSIFVDDQASVQTVGGNGTTMTLTAGANVEVLHTHANGSLVGSQNTSVGLISIQTGVGGMFTLDANSGNPGVYAGAGGVLIAADDMVLLDDVLVVNGGGATLKTASASRAIDLGTNTNGTLGLTSAEINQITASSLTIGDSSSSGSITFSTSITPNPNTLSLVTGSSVLSTTSSGLDVTVPNLGITAATGIGTAGTPLEFSADTLTTNTQGSNGSQFLSEANSVTISADDVRSGTGTITLTNGTYLTAPGGDIVGDVVVGSGVTLGGTGTVTGNVSGAGNVSPGNSPGTLTINGDFTPNGTVTLEVDPPAVTAGVDYDQIIVSGTVDLGGATLVLSGSTGAVSANRVLTLIQNSSASAITPNSAFANGDVVSINGNSYRLFYTGGTGDNDLILVENTTPAIVYVDDSFTGGLGNTIADADLGTTGSQAAIMGFNAFTSITAALAATTTSGTVIVNAGTYAETVSVAGTQTLKIGGTDAAQAVTINSLATVSGSTLNLAGTSSLTFGDSTNVTMAGLITGGGSLVKQGSGIVTVSGDNDYSGATTVSVGTLRVTANNGLGTTAAGTTVASGAVLDLRNVTYSTAEAVSLQGGTLSNSNGTTSFSGIVTMTADGTFSTSSSTLVLAGAVQGAFRLNKSGAGTVRLSNTGNSFSSISIGAGTLQLGASGVIPDTVNVIASSDFDLNGFDEAFDSIVGSGSIGNSQVTTATLTLGANNNSGDSRFNGPITGALNLVKIGTGRQTLGSGSSSFTGTTTVNAGILAVTTENGGAATQALGAASGGTIVNAGGILEFQGVAYAPAEPITVNGGIIRATAGGNNPTFGSTSFGGTITLSTGTATFNTTTAATLTLNGIIDGDQALTKTGVGTLILANDNIYTGNTTVSAGKLMVNGSLASSSAVVVNSGGTLAGSGTINGAVTVASGGTISPGSSPGVLNTGNLSFASGSTYVVELNGTADGSFDQLNVTGTVSLDNATLSLSGSITSGAIQPIVIINNDGQDTVTQTFNNLPEGAIVAINGVPFQITYQGGTDNNDVVLTEVANVNVVLDSGNLTFTDLLGNISDNMSLSFDGTDYILINSSQLLFTQIAGAAGSGTNIVRVPASAVTGSSIILNGAGGADTLTITYGSSNLVDTVTLNGGAGNDILRTTGTATAATELTINGDADDDTINLNADLTFVADSSMNVDLQDDAAVPGTDSISVGSNANMAYSGSGAVKLTASSISFATGSSVATASGNVVVETATLSLNGSIATTGASLTLLADSLTISTTGIVDGDANTVTIRPQSDGTAVNLGSDDGPGSLGLTVSELNRVTAGTLVIGGFTSGSVTISADITRSVNTSVQLMSGDSIIQNSAAGSLNTTGGTLLLTPDSSGSHNPNRSGIDVTASTVSYTAGSSVTIDVGGNAVDSEYTQLNVSGTVSLADVDLILTGSFIPAFGDTFVIVSATSVTGEFSSHADGTTFSFNGRTMRIDYTATDVTLTDATPQSPVLTTPDSVMYTENDGATAIASGVVVSDADNATLASATVTITNFVTGEDVLSFTNDGLTMGNIAISTNIGGVLTLTSALSAATKAEWQAALRSVNYLNSSENPTTTDRSVEFVISDGTLSSNTLTSTISIAGVNDAPNLVTLSPTTASLAENSSTVSSTTLATIAVTDVDSGTNSLSLSGTDAAFFEIVGNELRLVAGTVLDFETKSSYDVTVEVNDAAVGGTVDASQSFTLTLTNVLDTTPDADTFVVTYSLSDVTITHAINGGVATSLGSFPLNVPITLDGLSADDAVRIIGTSGDDTFVVSNSGLTINGSELILNGPASRTLIGALGNDTYSFDADDLLGHFTLDESAGGVDTISFATTESANVVLSLAVASTQTVHATNLSLNLGFSTKFENILGGQGNDTLTGNGRNNTLNGGAGNDKINGGVGSDVLIGGTDNDTYIFGVAVPGEADQIQELLNEGTDTLNFAPQTTSLSLNLWDPEVQAVHTNRTLQLSSGRTIENVIGGSGADRITGNRLNNMLTGGAGHDTLNGSTGDDILSGGQGNDTYFFSEALEPEADRINESVDQGSDSLRFASLSVEIVLNLGTSLVQNVHTNRTLKLNSASTMENVVGGTGSDTLTGNALANRLWGNDGNNILVGLAGDDMLFGGPGRDLLIGGLGADTLDAGNGDDILIAGRTTIDTNNALLSTLRTEWISANTYQDRITNLRAGVGSPIVSLQATINVLNDANEIDTLTGGTGFDWYFQAVDDVITDLFAGAVVDVL